MQPDPSRISSLADFPVPRDQTGVRSFLGLCNQLAFFIPDYQQHTVALRQLMGKGRSFLWLPEHQVEFDKLKRILTRDMIVRHFDSSIRAVLLTDASRLFGLGYALGQQRYSTIELECLAIIWAIQKCAFFLKGLPTFLVLTDHRPLEGPERPVRSSQP